MPDPFAPLSAQARAAEARLLAEVERLAAALTPPFSAADRRRIARQTRLASEAFARLSALHSAFLGTRPVPGSAESRFFQRYGRLFPLWHQRVDTLRLWLRAPPLPLYPETVSAPLLALERLMEQIHLALSPEPPRLHGAQAEMHGDIPLPMGRFLGHLHAAFRLRRAMGADRGSGRFLDVGCGIGLKVLAAAEYFGEAEGLDYDPALASAAQGLLDRARRNRSAAETAETPWALHHLGRPGRAFHADALRFEGYATYDVIYAYRPIADAALRRRLEERIVAMAPPGSLLIMPYPEFSAEAERLGCASLGGAIHLTPGGTEAPETLRARVGHVGTALPEPLAEDEGFTAPLGAVLRHWGQIG